MAPLNGRLPPELLGRVRGVLFPLRFVAQVEAFAQAFEAEFGVPLEITDGYRPYSGNYYAQVETMLRRYKPADEFRRLAPGYSTAGRKSHVWNGVRRYLLPGQAQVAFPGTSNHGKADAPALDLGSGINVMDSRRHKWAVANAPRFGLRWPSWARAGGEPWHFDVVAHVQVSNTASTAPTSGIPIPTGSLPGGLTPEDDMFSDDDRARLERLENILSIKGRPYALPEATLAAVQEVQQTVNTIQGQGDYLIGTERIPGQPFSRTEATLAAVQALEARVIAQQAALDSLAAGNGDPAAVRAAVDEALAGFRATLTLTVQEGGPGA